MNDNTIFEIEKKVGFSNRLVGFTLVIKQVKRLSAFAVVLCHLIVARRSSENLNKNLTL